MLKDLNAGIFSSEEMAIIKKGYKVLYRDGNSLNEALDILKGMANDSLLINFYIDFIEKSNRGIIR